MTLDSFNALTVTVRPQSVLWKCKAAKMETIKQNKKDKSRSISKTHPPGKYTCQFRPQTDQILDQFTQ